MKINIISYSKFKKNRFLSYVYLVIIIVGIGSMVKGPIGNVSLYIKYNAPMWLYVATSILVLFLFILMMNHVIVGIPKIGIIEISGQKMKISCKDNVSYFGLSELKNVKFSWNYMRLEPDIDEKPAIFEIYTKKIKLKFDILITEEDKEKLDMFLNNSLLSDKL